MELLEGVELGEEGVEAAEELERRGGVQVADGGDGEPEEQVVCGAAGEPARVEVGHAVEVGAVEEVGIEPVYTALVPTSKSAIAFLSNISPTCLQKSTMGSRKTHALRR